MAKHWFILPSKINVGQLLALCLSCYCPIVSDILFIRFIFLLQLNSWFGVWTVALCQYKWPFEALLNLAKKKLGKTRTTARGRPLHGATSHVSKFLQRSHLLLLGNHELFLPSSTSTTITKNVQLLPMNVQLEVACFFWLVRQVTWSAPNA